MSFEAKDLIPGDMILTIHGGLELVVQAYQRSYDIKNNKILTVVVLTKRGTISTYDLLTYQRVSIAFCEQHRYQEQQITHCC